MIQRKKRLSPAQLKFNVGDKVKFTLEKNEFVGIIEKRYINSFLVHFKTKDPELVDKYHNRTIINNKNLKLVKAASKK